MDPQKSILEGEMMVNGKPREKNWKGISGYVLQDDVKEKKKKKILNLNQINFSSFEKKFLHGDLTVYQNLWYAAQFKLPSTLSVEEKRNRVDHLITKLGLDSCKNRVIGTAFRTGISGGQRKRVSVAITLLTEPKIIFRKKKNFLLIFI